MITVYPKQLQYKSEDQLQAACYQWAYNQYEAIRGLLWAVPNGGSRHPLEAAKFKATGVTEGVHDLHMYWQGRFTTFEMKHGQNTMSNAQKIWAAKIDSQGGDIYVCYTLEQFQEAFKKAYHANSHTP
jgi:hypothetical protein